MDLPPDPMAQAWQSLWFALGGGLLYVFFDLLFLRHNASFQRGRAPFRVGVGLVVVGVLLGGLAWYFFGRANLPSSNWALYASFAVRAVGVVLLLVGVWKMAVCKDITAEPHR